MRILITSFEHPHYKKTGRITGTIPPIRRVSRDKVYIVELDGGVQKTTVIDGEYRVERLQDA